VEDLSAKPIIDVAIELKDFQEGEKCLDALKELGYS